MREPTSSVAPCEIVSAKSRDSSKPWERIFRLCPSRVRKLCARKWMKPAASSRPRRTALNTIRSNIKARAEEKMHETKEAVSEWKTKREIRKLNARADRDEAYAADATDFAVASIAEAELAVLDAVVARLDADAAQSPAPAAH